jgi:hypothetical protein
MLGISLPFESCARCNVIIRIFFVIETTCCSDSLKKQEGATQPHHFLTPASPAIIAMARPAYNAGFHTIIRHIHYTATPNLHRDLIVKQAAP